MAYVVIKYAIDFTETVGVEDTDRFMKNALQRSFQKTLLSFMKNIYLHETFKIAVLQVVTIAKMTKERDIELISIPIVIDPIDKFVADQVDEELNGTPMSSRMSSHISNCTVQLLVVPIIHGHLGRICRCKAGFTRKRDEAVEKALSRQEVLWSHPDPSVSIVFVNLDKFCRGAWM